MAVCCNSAIVTSGGFAFKSNTVCVSIIKKSRGTREQAITDLIESAALQGTALAHILNAEGEKMQAIMAMNNISNDRLMRLNSSVTRLLSSAARFEMIMQSKLDLFRP